MSKIAIVLFGVLAIAAAMQVPEEVPQEKFFFNFPWIPLPNIPTRPPVVAVPPPVQITACPAAPGVAPAAGCNCGATAPVVCKATQACDLANKMCYPICADQAGTNANPAACYCGKTTAIVCTGATLKCTDTAGTGACA